MTNPIRYLYQPTSVEESYAIERFDYEEFDLGFFTEDAVGMLLKKLSLEAFSKMQENIPQSEWNKRYMFFFKNQTIFIAPYKICP